MAKTNEMDARKKIGIVAKWKASGISQAEFCRNEGLQEWQLSEWKRFAAKKERQSESSAVVAERESPRSPALNTKSTGGGRRTLRGNPDAAAVGASPFVPVTLVDVSAETSGVKPTANVFDYVLEVVLKRGQIVRVGPNCQPHFLSAVVSTLDHA